MVWLNMLFFTIGVICEPSKLLSAPFVIAGIVVPIRWVCEEFYEQLFSQYAEIKDTSSPLRELITEGNVGGLIEIAAIGINMTLGR